MSWIWRFQRVRLWYQSLRKLEDRLGGRPFGCGGFAWRIGHDPRTGQRRRICNRCGGCQEQVNGRWTTLQFTSWPKCEDLAMRHLHRRTGMRPSDREES